MVVIDPKRTLNNLIAVNEIDILGGLYQDLILYGINQMNRDIRFD